MMRKLFAVMLVVFCASRAWGAYYDNNNSGDSWETAYVINSAAELEQLKNRVNSGTEPSGKYYKLNADIDLTSQTDWIGIGSDMNYPFMGHFDGQNHTVKLAINNLNMPSSLFSIITVSAEQIAVKNLNITGTIKAFWTGGFVWTLASGIIENCSFTGTIEGYGEWAGGIADLMLNGTVRNCRVNVKSTSVNSGGGIIAEFYGGSIENCTIEAGSEISANSYAGGIAGLMHGGIIRNCTSNAVLKNAKLKGGIVGGATSEVSRNLSGNTWPSREYTQIGLVADQIPYEPESYDIPVSSDIEATWNGHRYQIFHENLTWEQARQRCENLGGHLATITSQAEQNIIASMLARLEHGFAAYWLGAKADELGFWHWVTDEVFEQQYNNYAQGQPDGSGNYLQIYASGEWDDVYSAVVSSNPRGFICEWDEEPEPVEEAELSPEFLEWQANPEIWSESDGAAPSPEDTSHLRNNPPKNSRINSAFFAADNENLDDSYDSRKKIGLPEVRNQGSFQTCWAFATLGAMEANYRKQSLDVLGEYPDFSELHLAWFAYKDPNFRNKKASAVVLNSQGDPDRAAEYLLLRTGPISEDSMSYSIAGTEANGSNERIEVFLKLSDDTMRLAGSFDKPRITLKEKKLIANQTSGLNDYVNIEVMNHVKQAIIEHGAVYFHYKRDKDGYDEENHSFYSHKETGRNSHAALLVGWDDNYSRENFKTKPPQNGAWLVRDSYGPESHDKGYFWMSYNQGDRMNYSRVFVVQEESPDAKSYNNNEAGKTKNISPQWSAAIFRSQRDESLVRVAFHTTDNNAKYDIFVNNWRTIFPTDPGEAERPIFSGEYSNAGYHTVSLPSPIDLRRGNYYSVIMKMTLFSDYPYPTGVGASIDKYASPDVKAGESFFAFGDNVPSLWIDGKNIDGGPYDATISAITIPKVFYDVRPEITTEILPEASEGQPYTFNLEAAGTGPIEWRSGNVPSGFELSREGVLSGNASETGDFEVNFTVLNDAGSETKTLMLKVKPITQAESEDVKPRITTTELIEAEEGTSYSFTFEASGAGEIEWSGANVPIGLILSSSGVLRGRLLSEGNYIITVTAMNSAGSDTKAFVLKVNARDHTDPLPDNNGSGGSGGCSAGFGVMCWICGFAVLLNRR